MPGISQLFSKHMLTGNELAAQHWPSSPLSHNSYKDKKKLDWKTSTIPGNSELWNCNYFSYSLNHLLAEVWKRSSGIICGILDFSQTSSIVTRRKFF